MVKSIAALIFIFVILETGYLLVSYYRLSQGPPQLDMTLSPTEMMRDTKRFYRIHPMVSGLSKYSAFLPFKYRDGDSLEDFLDKAKKFNEDIVIEEHDIQKMILFLFLVFAGWVVGLSLSVFSSFQKIGFTIVLALASATFIFTPGYYVKCTLFWWMLPGMSLGVLGIATSAYLGYLQRHSNRTFHSKNFKLGLAILALSAVSTALSFATKGMFVIVPIGSLMAGVFYIGKAFFGKADSAENVQ